MSDKNSSCIGSNNLLEYALPDHKGIDILVNNSGYPFDKNIWYKKFHEGVDEELDRIIEVDLKDLCVYQEQLFLACYKILVLLVEMKMKMK